MAKVRVSHVPRVIVQSMGRHLREAALRGHNGNQSRRRIIHRGHLLRLIFALCVTLSGGVLRAQSNTYPPMALVNAEGELAIYGLAQTPQVVTSGGRLDIWQPVWDAAGRYLAYTNLDLASYTSTLMLFDTQSNTLVQLADGLIPGFPAAFTQENTGLLYVSRAESPDESGLERSAALYRVGLPPDAVPEQIGQFAYKVGCGGDMDNGLSQAYAQETETTPGWGFMILAETPYGVLHSGDCGGRHIGLLDPATGEDRPLPAEVFHMVLSPDRTQAVGLQTGDDAPVVLIDLANGEAQALPVTQSVADLAWANADTIFFSARGDTSDLWEIWRLTLTTGEATRLYQVGGTHLLARLTPTADGSGLYFSHIAQPAGQDAPALVNLIRLDLQSGIPATIGSDLHKTTLNPLAS